MPNLCTNPSSLTDPCWLQVAGLKEVLTKEQVVVEEKSKATAELLEFVGKEKVVVQEQSDIAAVEEAKTNKIVVEVDAFANVCVAAAQKVGKYACS